VEIVLSGERYMPGLVEGLIGAKAGDTLEVSFKGSRRDYSGPVSLALCFRAWFLFPRLIPSMR
jgi:hypothetical protein